jgi:rhomboid protease GluP
MTDASTPPEDQAPATASPATSAPARDLIAESVRRRGLAGLAVFGGLGALLFLQTTTASGESYISVGVCAVLAAFHLVLFLRPPRVRIADNAFQITGLGALKTHVDNVIDAVFDGDGMGVTFDDLAEVEADSDARAKLQKTFEKEGFHAHVPGLSLAQVEEARQLLEIEPPAADEPAYRTEELHRALMTGTPHTPVTFLLIVANVAVFALMVFSGVRSLSPTWKGLIESGGDYGPFTLNGEWWRLLTGAFVHAGLLHLICSLWLLFDLGALMERLLGSIAFLAVYLVSALAGSVASIAWAPTQVHVGAAAALFGVGGALLGVMLVARPGVPLTVVWKLWPSALTFVLYNLFVRYLVPGIDHPAHVGGALAGYLAGAVAGLLAGVVLGRWLAPQQPGRLVVPALAIAVAGCVVAGVVASQLPRRPADHGKYFLVHEDFKRVEPKAMRTFQDALARAQRREIDTDELADIIEKEVLPPWSELRERMADIHEVPSGGEKRHALYVAYMQAREEAWDTFVRYLRAPAGKDADLRNSYHEKDRQADDIGEEINNLRPSRSRSSEP